MATGIGVNQGKTAFVEEFLAGNRDANLEGVNEAWRSAGNGDTVSPSLVNKVRSRLGLTARRTAKAPMPSEEPLPAKAKPSKPAKGKVASKPKETAPRPQEPGGETGPLKTSFVREVLGREPKANVKAINEAWAAAGNEGKISDSIIYNAKRGLGTPGKATTAGPSKLQSSPKPAKGAVAPKPKKSPETAKPEPTPSTVEATSLHVNGNRIYPELNGTKASHGGDHGRELHEIEGEIDELVFRLRGLGGYAEVQEALRAARRMLVRSHGH